MSDHPSDSINKIFIFDGSIQYPSGYQGETIPDTLPVETVPLTYWANFKYSNTQQLLVAMYENKQTDPTSNLQDPIYITFKLWEDASSVSEGGKNVCERNTKVDEQFNTQLHCEYSNFQIDKQKQYYLTAEINPSLNPQIDLEAYDITFKRSTFHISFKQNSAGSTTNCTYGALNPIESVRCASPATFDPINCFQAEFPFIDIEQCSETFQVLISQLNFGGIVFPELKHDPQCRSLNTMDDWLGLPDGYNVCPQIPAYVRQVTTPFVAFLLGLLTMGFIKRVRQDFDG